MKIDLIQPVAELIHLRNAAWERRGQSLWGNGFISIDVPEIPYNPRNTTKILKNIVD